MTRPALPLLTGRPAPCPLCDPDRYRHPLFPEHRRALACDPHKRTLPAPPSTPASVVRDLCAA